MEVSTVTKNWVQGESPSILERIHENDVNIAIFDRDTSTWKEELNDLLQKDFEFRSSGDFDMVTSEIGNAVDLNGSNLLKQDITNLLQLFRQVTDANSFRLLLATVTGNMCTKFHTDINDLRMLCTYSGPGTLWLTEDNVNRKALDCCDEHEGIVIDESRVRQAQTGSVIILKGAIYPKDGTTPILHRSPSIEESRGKRLLLRLDTNEFASF